MTLAFAYSKQTFVQEMEDIAKYKRMPFHEFLEFIGRLAQIKFIDDPQPLDKKVELVLEILLGLVNEKVKQPLLDFEIESESDYDDDLIEEAMQRNNERERLKEEVMTENSVESYE